MLRPAQPTQRSILNHQQPIRSRDQGSTLNHTPEGRGTPCRMGEVVPVRAQRRRVVAEAQARHVAGVEPRPNEVHIVVVQHLAEHHRMNVARPEGVAESTGSHDIGLRHARFDVQAASAVFDTDQHPRDGDDRIEVGQ